MWRWQSNRFWSSKKQVAWLWARWTMCSGNPSMLMPVRRGMAAV
jgi:hypothetical protein